MKEGTRPIDNPDLLTQIMGAALVGMGSVCPSDITFFMKVAVDAVIDADRAYDAYLQERIDKSRSAS